MHEIMTKNFREVKSHTNIRPTSEIVAAVKANGGAEAKGKKVLVLEE